MWYSCVSTKPVECSTYRYATRSTNNRASEFGRCGIRCTLKNEPENRGLPTPNYFIIYPPTATNRFAYETVDGRLRLIIVNLNIRVVIFDNRFIGVIEFSPIQNRNVEISFVFTRGITPDGWYRSRPTGAFERAYRTRRTYIGRSRRTLLIGTRRPVDFSSCAAVNVTRSAKTVAFPGYVG